MKPTPARPVKTHRLLAPPELGNSSNTRSITVIQQVSPRQRRSAIQRCSSALEVFGLPVMNSRRILSFLVTLCSLFTAVHHAFAQDWMLTGAPTNPWQSIASSANGNKLIATASGAGLIYASTNSGTNWNATGAPDKVWNALASSADGANLLSG